MRTSSSWVIFGALLAGCEAEPSAVDTPLTEDMLAPPSLTLEYTGTAMEGETVELVVTLPVAATGKRTVFVMSEGGTGNDIGLCPGLLNGDCLDIASPQEIIGREDSDAGVSTLSYTLGDAGTYAFQAVVIHNGNGFATDTLEIEVTADDGRVTVANCAESYDSNVPSFYTTYFGCSDITLDGGEVSISTDGLPPHQSPYYDSSDPNYVAWDDRGGTHYQNPGTIAAQDITFVIPNDPVPKGITIDASMVDNAMNTSDEEYNAATVGIALDGVALFAAMAGGNDDLADEQYTFDLLEGHPAGDEYHYHFETSGPLEVLKDRGIVSTSEPGAAEMELYGVMCDGTLVFGCTELDGTAPNDTDFDAQNGHVHDIDDGSVVHFTDRYHTHVCPDVWPDYPYFPEIAYYDDSACGGTGGGSTGGGTGGGPGGGGPGGGGTPP